METLFLTLLKFSPLEFPFKAIKLSRNRLNVQMMEKEPYESKDRVPSPPAYIFLAFCIFF